MTNTPKTEYSIKCAIRWAQKFHDSEGILGNNAPGMDESRKMTSNQIKTENQLINLLLLSLIVRYFNKPK